MGGALNAVKSVGAVANPFVAAQGAIGGAVGPGNALSFAANPFIAGQGALLNSAGGGDSQTPVANTIDPNLVAMQKSQAKSANDYSANMGNLRADQGNAAEDSSRNKLAKSLAQTNASSNSRGLLYGGYNQGQRANTIAGNQSELNATKANINTDTQNNLNTLQNQAIQSGLGLQNAQNQLNQNNFNYQMNRQKQQQEAEGGLLSGVAKIGGMAMGR
jgi:hypothetical protein